MRRRPAAPVVAVPDQMELEIVPPATVELDATSELADERDISAMADPDNAHSPMSPDDHVSSEHTGLHTEEHSTGGNTPAS